MAAADPADSETAESLSPAERRARRARRVVGTTVILDDDRAEAAARERAAEALRQMEEDPSRFIVASRPMQAALLLAGTRSLSELRERESDDSRPAIVAMAEKAMLRAAEGSPAHLALVQERLEGKVGLRAGDVIPLAAGIGRGDEVGEAIEDAIRRMTEAKRGTPEAIPPDDGPDIENTPRIPRDRRIQPAEMAQADPVPEGDIVLASDDAAREATTAAAQNDPNLSGYIAAGRQIDRTALNGNGHAANRHAHDDSNEGDR